MDAASAREIPHPAEVRRVRDDALPIATGLCRQGFGGFQEVQVRGWWQGADFGGVPIEQLQGFETRCVELVVDALSQIGEDVGFADLESW